jgi:hypothetical protein
MNLKISKLESQLTHEKKVNAATLDGSMAQVKSCG